MESKALALDVTKPKLLTGFKTMSILQTCLVQEYLTRKYRQSTLIFFHHFQQNGGNNHF
jgi:hypothetical protein